MLDVNYEIDPEIASRESEAYLGGGCYGKVYAWGPKVVKVGQVSHKECENLNEANRRMGDETFPRAWFLRDNDWGSDNGVMLMDRIPGMMLCDATDDHNTQSKVLYAAKKTLECYGIRHGDLHSGNVMVNGVRVHIVDGSSLSFMHEKAGELDAYWKNQLVSW